MHHPALAERVGDLGEYLRFQSSLPGDVRELAILITARAASQPYPRELHDSVQKQYGVTGLLELVVLAGYYGLIAGVLFAFDVRIPPGTTAPF